MTSPNIDSKKLEKLTQISSITTYTLYFLLLGVLSINYLSGAEIPKLKVLAIQLVPLLVLLPGMIAKYYRTYSWLCFVLLIYFIFAVEHAFMSKSDILDYLFVLLTVLLFISSMMTSRWMQRFQKFKQIEISG